MSDTEYNLFDDQDEDPEEIAELLTDGSNLLEGEEEAEEVEEVEGLGEPEEFEDPEELKEGSGFEEEDENLLSEDEPGLTEEIDPELKEIYERIKTRKAERKAKSRRRKRILTISSFVLILFILSFTKLVNVDRIVVEGNSYFLDSEIISMSHAKMGNNLIYRPGKLKIKSYLLQNPYIEKVRVKRRLPSTLVIQVKEREQMAAVPYNEEYIVTDEERIVLRKTTDMPKLTIIEGIKIKKMNKGEKLEGEDEKHIDDSYELLRLMKEHKLFFKKISVNKDDTMIYIYDNLICTGKTSDVKATIEKNRMQEILKTLLNRGVQRGRIVVSENGYAAYMPNLN